MLLPGNPSSSLRSTGSHPVATPESQQKRFSTQKNTTLILTIIFISGCVHPSRVSDPYPSGSPVVTTEPAGPRLIPEITYQGNQATIEVTKENWCVATTTTPMVRDEYEVWNKTPLLLSTAIGSAALMGLGLSMSHSCGGVDSTDELCDTTDKVRGSIEDDGSANAFITAGILVGAAGVGLLLRGHWRRRWCLVRSFRLGCQHFF